MFTPEMKQQGQDYIAEEVGFSNLVGLMSATVEEAKKGNLDPQQFALMVISIGAHLEHLLDTNKMEK